MGISAAGVGSEAGSNPSHIYRNRIDVLYSSKATTGGYVENNVYGIRDRYSSGDNLFEDNTIIACRRLPTNNPYAFQLDYADSVSIMDNIYATEGGFMTGSALVTKLTNSNNTVLAPAATTPAAPTGLKITKFLDSYLIEWNANSEADVYEYVVYRDGVKLTISPRGGTFYVDVGIGGTHNYSVSALTLTGVEGAQSGGGFHEHRQERLVVRQIRLTWPKGQE